MRHLINGVEFNKLGFEAELINSLGWNEDFKEVMSDLVGGNAQEFSGDTFEVK